MFLKHTFTRSISTIMTFVFGLSLFALAPIASAANPLIQNVTVGLDPFHINVPNHSAVNYIDYDYNTGGLPTGPVLEQIRDENDQVVHEFGNIGTDDKATGSYQLTWDGTVLNGGPNDGESVPDGTYKVYLYSETASLPAAEQELSFVVENTVIPEVSLVTEPPSFYYTPSGNYDVNYNLELHSASLANVHLTIEGPLNNSPQNQVMAVIQNSDGNYVMSWDGKIAAVTATPGEYSYTLDAEGSVDGFGVPSEEVTGTFTVSNDANPQPSNQCAGYSDVSENDPNCDAIEYVQSIGAMTGHPDGTFRQSEILQRDQVAKISLETFGLFNSSSDYCGGSAAFPDVPSSQWSYQYICRGVDLDMITGYESGADAGYYRPERSVNRVEFLALILRNTGETMPSVNSSSYGDVETGLWFSGYAKYSYDHSLFVGNNLNPTNHVSRNEVAEVLYDLHNQGVI